MASSTLHNAVPPFCKSIVILRLMYASQVCISPLSEDVINKPVQQATIKTLRLDNWIHYIYGKLFCSINRVEG